MDLLFTARFVLDRPESDPPALALLTPPAFLGSGAWAERLSRLLGTKVEIELLPDSRWRSTVAPSATSATGTTAAATAPENPDTFEVMVSLQPGAAWPSRSRLPNIADAAEDLRDTIEKSLHGSNVQQQVEVSLLSFSASDSPSRVATKTPPPVPMLSMDDSSSRSHLALVLERIHYLLQRVAAEPAQLLEGRYHQSLRDALADVDERVAHAGGWRSIVDRADRILLLDHGLMGQQWAFKYQAFDQKFQEFLDRMAALEQVGQRVQHRVEALEIDAFAGKVREASESAGSVLERAEPLLDSLVKATGTEPILDAVKEVGSVVKGLVRWFKS